MSDRRCKRCGGGWLPEWGDFANCPQCREKHNADQKARSATPKGRKARAAAMTRYRAGAGGEVVRAYEREVYAQRKEAGICIDCEAPALADNNRCQSHRDQHRAAALAWYHRNKPTAARAS